MNRCTSVDRYLQALSRRSALPQGFSAATASLSFLPREKPKRLAMNLALILLDEPTSSFAARYTRNRLAGAPVLIGRERLAEPRVRGVLINNKIANVGAANGIEDARTVLRALGEILGTPERQLLPASTGIVGWGLPVADMLAALPELAAALQRKSLLPVAQAIMTTDRYPKVRRARVGSGSIVGVAKGAGMIEPSLATLLVFLLTDVDIGRSALREELAFCTEASFNRISVDGDQSTSDMAVALSSRRKPAVPRREFRRALLEVCRALAEDIVRNGEGVGHVIQVVLRGFAEPLALGLGKAVVNSPLVKTAVFGNDPNVGRIVAALGDHLSAAPGAEGCKIEELTVRLGGIPLYEGGAFRLNPGKEQALASYLRRCAMDPSIKGFPPHELRVRIEVERRGRARGPEVEVLGADLSSEYVRENADYRS